MDSLQYRPPQLTDVPALTELEAALNPTKVSTPGMPEMLRWVSSNRNSLRHSSYARVLTLNGRMTGFVSGTLVTDLASRSLEQKPLMGRILDPSVCRPIDDEGLRHANSHFGSVLYLTSCFWREPGHIDRDIDVAMAAFSRLAKWFEGNRIAAIMIVVENRFMPFAEAILGALEPSSWDTRPTDGASTFIQIRGPLERRGPTQAWLLPLLKPYVKPKHVIRDELKLDARTLHEYDFDFREAILSGALQWTWNEPPIGKAWSVQQSAPKVKTWRTNMKEDLGIRVNSGDRERDIMVKLQRILRDEPAIMALASERTSLR